MHSNSLVIIISQQFVIECETNDISDGDTDDYTAASNVLFGATHYKDKVILTLPRMLDGIPATLNYVNFSSGKSPQLIPFPSVEVNSLEVSVKLFALLLIRQLNFRSIIFSAKPFGRSESHRFGLSKLNG